MALMNIQYIAAKPISSKKRGTKSKKKGHKRGISGNFIPLYTGNFSEFLEKGTSKQVTFRNMLRKIHQNR